MLRDLPSSNAMGLGSPKFLLSAVLLFALASFHSVSDAQLLPPPCDRPIYCHGLLLHTVQMSAIFEDSKHFVDMVMKQNPDIIQEAFDQLIAETKGHPNKTQVHQFVDKYFAEPDSAFVPWNPEDWKPDPASLHNVSDPALKEWGQSLHGIWKELGRQISVEVKNSPERYSQIYVSHPMIVPGGRFREFYYWDSFWTIEGLLQSGMTKTVKGMLSNFIELVDKFDMIPNGGRIYYERRSQPPYLIPMMKAYIDHTGDIDFLRQKITLLESEYLFWLRDRMTPLKQIDTGKIYNVAQYNVQVRGPRPESYREDYLLAQKDYASEKDKTQLYVDLKSAAESGWDFSSRWFIPENPEDIGTLADLKTTKIAPLDLNSLLCYNAKVLSEFYIKLGNTEKAAEYIRIAREKMDLLDDYFWDEEDGVWYDFHIDTMEKRRTFYLQNIHPIWTGCYGGHDGKNKKAVLDRVIKYLKKVGVLNYIGGVPTSLKDSNQQWDFPNAWAPLQHLIVMGLYQSRSIHPEAEEIAFKLAQKWIATNYKGFQQTEGMFEKYNVSSVGRAGGGGEYTVVTGFGWTNGVDLKFLNVFGDRLKAEVDYSTLTDSASLVHISLSAILMVVLLLVVI